MLVFLATASWAGELVLEVKGLDRESGRVECSLYGTATAWLDVALKTVWATPESGKARCNFGEQAPGEYAVAFFHDANDNGRMDYNVLGLPLEAWGVSRDAPVFLSRPRFVDARFAHPGAPVPMTAR